MATRKPNPEPGDAELAAMGSSTDETGAADAAVVDQVNTEVAPEAIHRPRYEGSKPPAIRLGGTHNFEV